MTIQNILTADVLDIVFENRNKAYGAYALRKYYDKRLMHSLGIMLLIVTSVILLSFRFGKKPVMNDKREKAVVTILDLQPPADEKKKEPEKPKELPKPQQKMVTKEFETFKNKTIEIVDDNKVTPKDTVVSQELLDTRANGNETKQGEPGGQELGKVSNVPVNGDPSEGEETVDPNSPMDVADTPPSYPGGIEALQNFLRRHLRTPDELEAGQEAAVKVKFVVNAEGEMYGYEVLHSAGNTFDNEVIRVLKKMPRWNPGKYKGQSVSVYYVIPVKFQGLEE